MAAGGVRALDAGCGRRSAFLPFRDRLAEVVGVDLHEPAAALPWLDSFKVVDVCRDADAFPPGRFDVVLSSFTVEHFTDPPAAFRTLFRWLRPPGSLVLTTATGAIPSSSFTSRSRGGSAGRSSGS